MKDPFIIYDGFNDESTKIAALCGKVGSFGISSTKNSLFVKFESSSDVAWGDDWGIRGFFATIHYGNPCICVLILNYTNNRNLFTIIFL